MDFHELANIFPMMPKEKLEQLIADIKDNELVEPITIYEGKILDGRNRFIACQMAEIEPEFVPYTGNSPLSFVISKNIQRRHLTSSQRAALAAEIEPILAEEARQRQQLNALANQPQNKEKIPYLENADLGQSRDHAARQFQTNGRYVQDAKRFMNTAPDVFEQIKKGELSINQANNLPHVSYNNGDNEWYTPQEYINAAWTVMDGIDLDPASSEIANSIVKASTFYSMNDNGLNYHWQGRIWMNPPYARDSIQHFCDKLILHYQAGDITEAITLTNNATETKWFQSIANLAHALCLPEGRVQFWHPEKVSTPLQGQALLYFGLNSDKFLNEFRKFGVVWLRSIDN